MMMKAEMMAEMTRSRTQTRNVPQGWRGAAGGAGTGCGDGSAAAMLMRILVRIDAGRTWMVTFTRRTHLTQQTPSGWSRHPVEYRQTNNWQEFPLMKRILSAFLV